MRETDVTKIIAQIKNIIISENFKILTFKEYYLGCIVLALASKSAS